jgi:2-iminobutanoate/2-iminopropanoate deaminase
MISRMVSHCGDDSCPACVVAGDYVFLAHHAGGFESDQVAVQMRATFDAVRGTLASVGANLADIVQIRLYLRDRADFRAAREVFFEYFEDGFPARMACTTQFIDPRCLCMVEGVAYHPGAVIAPPAS